jgi:hypothetical protein
VNPGQLPVPVTVRHAHAERGVVEAASWGVSGRQEGDGRSARATDP